jgi:hypothetical protein
MRPAFSKFAIVGAAFAVIVGITVLITGQPPSKPSQQLASPHRVGVVDDWSHHHLVFSNPGTYEQAAKDPAALAKWLRIRYNTRFILQQMKRHAALTGGFSRKMITGGEEAVSPSGMVEPEGLAIGILPQLPGESYVRLKPKPKPKPNLPHPTGLWYGSLLAGTVQPNTYPAKWGASLTSASCGDYVVYPTGSAGTSTAASIVAYYNLSGCLGMGSPPSIYWAYNTAGTDTGAMVSTSPIVSLDGSQVAFIQSGGASGATLVLLKWGLPPTGTLTDPGSYSAHTLDYAFSIDEYRSATWPIYVSLVFNGATHNDTYSQPYYDYDDDVIYVGDDGGYLHQFTGVFNGTPTETVTTGTNPWPVKLSATELTSPVYDPVSGLVFVGDMGGYLYSVGTGTGTIGTTSGLIHGTTSSSLGDAIIDGPLVDASAQTVYAFVTTSSGNNTVYQFPTSFTSGTGNGSVAVGTGGAGYYLYGGTFDNVYYDSSPTGPSGNLYVVGNTGGATGATLYQIPITSNSMGGATGVVTGLTASGALPWPSPLTEFCNNGTTACAVETGGTCGTNVTCTTSGTDYLFFSVYRGETTILSQASNCVGTSGTGCVVALNVNNPASITYSGSLNTARTPSDPGCWATGGIVIDNSATTIGASQVYLINLSGNTAGGPIGAASTACAGSLPPASATGTVTSSSTSVTSTTGITTADVGMQITDTTRPTCIPAYDTITAYDNSTSTVTLATATSGTCATQSDALLIGGNIQAVQASQAALK